MSTPVLVAAQKLQSLETDIQKISIALSNDPSSMAIAMTMESLVELRNIVRADLAAIAAESYQTAIDIRMFSDEPDHLNATVFSSVISGFQRLFSLIFDATRNGSPKVTSTLPSESRAYTGFVPAAIYPGSIGVLMTLPTERYLTHQDELKTAAKTMNDLLSCRSSDAVHPMSITLGRAPIKAAESLAKSLSIARVGTEHRWFDWDESGMDQYIEYEAWRELGMAISEVEDESTGSELVFGRLVAGNVDKHRFELHCDDGKRYIGTLSDEFQECTLGKYYEAEIQVSTVSNPATGDYVERYHISSLKSWDPSSAQMA